MTTKLSQLKLNDIGGFKDFELNFHEHLTVFMGKNGAGKTTLLIKAISVKECTISLGLLAVFCVTKAVT